MKTPRIFGRPCRRAFTLTELLVVIAIISTLASLSVRGILSTKDRAKAVACVSNLREIGVAVSLHAMDHDGQLPEAWSASNVSYASVLEPYISQVAESVKHDRKNVFVCPGDKLQPQVTANTAGIYTYSMNDRLGKLGTMHLAQIKSPATTFLFTDGTQITNNWNLSSATVWLPTELFYPASGTNPDGLVPAAGDSDAGWEVQGNIRYRHGGAANFLMADGHVEAIKAGALRYRNGGMCD